MKVSSEKFYQNNRSILFSIIIIFVGMNVLYFTNLIPPIPLSLKDSGVYHSIKKYGASDYIAEYEDIGWRKYIEFQDDFHAAVGRNHDIGRLDISMHHQVFMRITQRTGNPCHDFPDQLDWQQQVKKAVCR